MRDRRALIGAQLGPPSPEVLDLVRSIDPATMGSLVGELSLRREDVEELRDHWDVIRGSTPWSSLLAAMVSRVERDRGDIDAPIAIWDDLDDHGTSGRLIGFYLVALQCEKMRADHRRRGVPDEVSDATLGALARHAQTHRLRHGTTGIDAAWWMQPILRGEILEVGSLKFHLVHLGVATLSPRPWLDEGEADVLGEGFRRGDLSLGVHIPARIDLSPAALDATFEKARDVLARVWPCTTRRLATCQSWMMDDRLATALGESSNVVGFQRRFTLIDPYVEDVEMVQHFVRGSDEGPLDPAALTRVQRVVFDVLSTGGRWRNRTGWLDFD
ncbi:MAG: DUF5596 domain-containing protein [Acidobacteria bacterium]|nr:DUF5596 domain-containing protein [Acidobacteriota bacterium]